MVEKVHGDSDQTGAAEVEPMIAFKYQMSQWKDVKGKHRTCCTIDKKKLKTIYRIILHLCRS